MPQLLLLRHLVKPQKQEQFVTALATRTFAPLRVLLPRQLLLLQLPPQFVQGESEERAGGARAEVA